MVKSYAKRENFFLGKLAALRTSSLARRNFDASKGRTQYHKEKFSNPGSLARSFVL